MARSFKQFSASELRLLAVVTLRLKDRSRELADLGRQLDLKQLRSYADSRAAFYDRTLRWVLRVIQHKEQRPCRAHKT